MWHFKERYSPLKLLFCFIHTCYMIKKDAGNGTIGSKHEGPLNPPPHPPPSAPHAVLLCLFAHHRLAIADAVCVEPTGRWSPVHVCLRHHPRREERNR